MRDRVHLGLQQTCVHVGHLAMHVVFRICVPVPGTVYKPVTWMK